MTDTERLDWLAINEFSLTPHREGSNDEYTIWWTVSTRRGKNMTHPFGTVREAIDAARASLLSRGPKLEC